MAADPANTAVHAPSSIASTKPYECSTRDKPPGAPWSVDYGACRTSLDLHAPADRVGSADPRCPVDCRHKAPRSVAVNFEKQFRWRGNDAAAAGVRAWLAS